MTEKSWKRTERRIAALLGGERVPIAGRQGADIAHSWLSIEAKHRQTLPRWLTEAIAQAQAAADDHQLPVVVLHEAGQRHDRDLVVMTLRDFREWFGDV